jgi:transcriptional regulator with XRE-family HTH domain
MASPHSRQAVEEEGVELSRAHPAEQRGADPEAMNRKGLGLGTQASVDEFTQRILNRAAQLGMNKQQLAERATLSRQTLNKLLRSPAQRAQQQSLVSISSFLLLAQALRVHPAWVIEGLFTDVVLDLPVETRMGQGRSPHVHDLNHPAGVQLAPGTRFTKRWRVSNPTAAAWVGVSLVCQDRALVLISNTTGEPLHAAGSLVPDAARMALPDLAPGAWADIEMSFTAPLTSGASVSRWLAHGPDGRPMDAPRWGAWLSVHVTTLADTLAFVPMPL